MYILHVCAIDIEVFESQLNAGVGNPTAGAGAGEAGPDGPAADTAPTPVLVHANAISRQSQVKYMDNEEDIVEV